jgi:hypothetical protein
MHCSGSLIGHPVENIRIVLTDGASHAVDSSELAFKLASIYAFRQVRLVIFVQSAFFQVNSDIRVMKIQIL